MWQEDQKEYMRANFAFLEREFAFLKDYGFSDIEFLFLEEDAQKGISFDAVIAIIRNAQELFVIKKLRAYYFEPLQFYLLQAGDPLSEIFTYHSEKEIDVYCRDSDLWEQAERSKKSLSDRDIIEVVAQSIKRQLKNGATRLYDPKFSPRCDYSARKTLMIKSKKPSATFFKRAEGMKEILFTFIQFMIAYAIVTVYGYYNTPEPYNKYSWLVSAIIVIIVGSIITIVKRRNK